MSEDKERRIELGGGYWLCSDQYCYWICKEYRYKDGKHKGETYLKRVSGYTASIQDAVWGFCESHIREIDARSIKTLTKEISALKSLVKGFKEKL